MVGYSAAWGGPRPGPAPDSRQPRARWERAGRRRRRAGPAQSTRPPQQPPRAQASPGRRLAPAPALPPQTPKPRSQELGRRKETGRQSQTLRPLVPIPQVNRLRGEDARLAAAGSVPSPIPPPSADRDRICPLQWRESAEEMRHHGRQCAQNGSRRRGRGRGRGRAGRSEKGTGKTVILDRASAWGRRPKCPARRDPRRTHAPSASSLGTPPPLPPASYGVR